MHQLNGLITQMRYLWKGNRLKRLWHASVKVNSKQDFQVTLLRVQFIIWDLSI